MVARQEPGVYTPAPATAPYLSSFPYISKKYFIFTSEKDGRLVRLFHWWGWKESNLLPSGYEPPALTDELQPHASSPFYHG